MTTHNINQNDVMEYAKLKKAYTTHKKYFNIVKKNKKSRRSTKIIYWISEKKEITKQLNLHISWSIKGK